MEGGWLSMSLSGLSLIGLIVLLLVSMLAAALAGYGASLKSQPSDAFDRSAATGSPGS